MTVQRAPINHENHSEQGNGSTLPYSEAKNLTDCLRIMGPDSGEYCRREVLGEDVPDASLPNAPPSSSTSKKKSMRINALDQTRGCAYTVTYSNFRKVNCDTAWINQKGTNPPGPLCGASVIYDITSVSAIGSKCPKLDGLKVSEVVKGNQGCTPRGTLWAGNTCTIGAGGKISGCTDIFTVCGITSDFKGDCTEIVDQEIEVGGQLAEEHEIIFDLKKNGKNCTGNVTRN